MNPYTPHYDTSVMYGEHEREQYEQQEQNAGGGSYGYCADNETYLYHRQEEILPGYYYPLDPPCYLSHVHSPISALCFGVDSNKLYSAGHTIRLRNKRPHATYSAVGSGSNNISEKRVSMLVGHTFPNGALHSSCAAHSEASKNVLDDISNSLFKTCRLPSNLSSPSNMTFTSTVTSRTKIPIHAYQPPYGTSTNTSRDSSLLTHFHKPDIPQMGISTILSFSSSSSNTNSTDTDTNSSFLCTISPSSVRIHSQGGVLLNENPKEGMLSGTFHPRSYENAQNVPSHVTVGGLSNDGHNISCMDLCTNGLTIISSHTIRSSNSNNVCVSDVATHHGKGHIVAACSDGTLRLMDGSWRIGGIGRECAKIEAHGGGVAKVAVRDNLICTTGYAIHRQTGSFKNDNLPYAFPDQHVLLFDVRYLGRGGIMSPFEGYKGGPRFVHFLSSNGATNESEQMILVGSGQVGGGLQLIKPFETSRNDEDVDEVQKFLYPPLNSGESITALTVMEREMALGTSNGNIFQYRMDDTIKVNRQSTFLDDKTLSNHLESEYEYTLPTVLSSSRKKENIHTDNVLLCDISKRPLNVQSDNIKTPDLSIDSSALQDNAQVQGTIHTTSPRSIFNYYVLQKDQVVTRHGEDESSKLQYSFGPLSEHVLRTSAKKCLSSKLRNAVANNKNDLVISITASDLNLDLINSKQYSKDGNFLMTANPNKLLNDNKISALCYDKNVDPRKKEKYEMHLISNLSSDDNILIPKRYKCKHRQPNSKFSMYQFAQLNETIFPGWDYPPLMPNAYACPIQLLLYFIPEVRHAIQNSQLLMSNSAGEEKKMNDLSTELCFLFHQIDSISSHSMCYSAKGESSSDNPVVGAFVPANFLSALSILPEAKALALLDGAPAACEVARRPEAFYRFLMHHLDKEISDCLAESVHNSNNQKLKMSTNKRKIIDNLQGLDFVCMNEFVSGSALPNISSTRGYTVDLAYDPFITKSGSSLKQPDFREVLHNSLCKEIRLRAWCQTTKSYETVIQRKIVNSLPQILSLLCACAGHTSNEGLPLWRKDDGDHWLPEVIEIEIKNDGNVVVRQLVNVDETKKEWKTFTKELSSTVSKALATHLQGSRTGKKISRYTLHGVVSFIRDGTRNEQGRDGHHVLHIRVPKDYKELSLKKQIKEIEKCFNRVESLNSRKDGVSDPSRNLVMNEDVTAAEFKRRKAFLTQELEELQNSPIPHEEWVLFNGPVVTNTIVDDVRAFHVRFKEPCILIFRQVPSDDDTPNLTGLTQSPKPDFPCNLIQPFTLKNTTLDPSSKNSEFPEQGGLVAFDAEFVQVQIEESRLTATGSKRTMKEGRNALARISLINCQTGTVIIDDHVLPREPVVDYLTRFSGIRPGDLDPASSTHRLITMRDAYLKMRVLLDRGCVFVGHGLDQDFLTVNMYVPPNQKIDTLLLFHQEKRRFISLRFLVNFLLGRDMQQDVHDSIEDARAAYDLYKKALELKKAGTFDKVLNKIYEFGERNDWKVGVEE